MSTKATGQTYYQVLEVSPSAPHHEIVAAYQRAKEAYAPDSPALYTMFTPDEANELRSLIEEAFLILGNQNKRKEYDQILLNRGSEPARKDLPDFAPRVEDSKSESKVNKGNNVVAMPTPNPPPPTAGAKGVPDGFAKSKLSVYEIKPDLETEIANQQVFDGPFFRKIRQYKNINLEQLSKETRISRSYITAIEGEDFASLPAPVFLRGFLIQLSRHLGLNENLATSSYLARVKKD